MSGAAPGDLTRRVSLTVNGTRCERDAPVRQHLGDFLRHGLGLTGTHLGCEHGVCGACTVLIDGYAMRSCLVLAVQAQDCTVLTIEGIGGPQATHPLQQAFRTHHGLQCGYCTPGMLLTLLEFLDRHPDPDEADIREAISGNLCRCTGYHGIVEAVLDAARTMRDAPTAIAS